MTHNTHLYLSSYTKVNPFSVAAAKNYGEKMLIQALRRISRSERKVTATATLHRLTAAFAARNRRNFSVVATKNYGRKMLIKVK